MQPSPVSGILLVILAGALSGSALLPMKYTRGWKFENTWLLYSLCAYLISPWIVALATVPNLGAVYSAAGAAACLLTAIFGFGWGLAVVLNGIGVNLVGLSLASAILMGSSVAVGSLAPLLLKDPGRIATPSARLIAVADFVMLSGVLLCAWAGDLRGKTQAREAPHARVVTTRGILVCFAAGLLSTLLNLALSYGEVISKQAIAQGSDPFNAANAVWGLAVTAGSLPSLLWCAGRLARHGEWKAYRFGNPARNAGLCVLMGILWIGGTVLYGAAAGMLGPLGPVVGWPVYMSGIILTSSFWGWLTGEWRGVTSGPAGVMMAGVAVQIIAMVLLGRTQ